MEIIKPSNAEEKQNAARTVLEALPEWFGMADSREEYIADVSSLPCWCAEEDGRMAGFLALKEKGRDTAELYVMGVLKAYHRRGIGKALFSAAYAYAKSQGYSFLQVKTVQMGHYEAYDRTNRFYRALGFKEFEVFPTLWDKWNPCQVYVMSIA